MTEYLFAVVYAEGVKARRDKVSPLDNPYLGVSNPFAEEWNDGWWDEFDGE